MGLREYKSKRRFNETPEPKGTVPDLRTEQSEVVELGLSPHEAKQLIFVIHKHAARALHYDLRLEMEGVLKSWAVPKGPSLDPSVKRLALMVEDHPFDYKDFEGVIPEGNYGAGNVIIWDRGFYHHPSATGKKENERLLLEGLKKGDLKFMLEGEKLHGQFTLVKTGKDDKSWLLFKKKDEYAAKQDVLSDNRSVVSNRTLEDVSDIKPKKSRINRIHVREAVESEDLSDAPMTPMPHAIKPMLSTLIKEPFDDPDWLFEVKWDGYRSIAEISGGDVSLYSRNQLSLNKKFAPIREALKKSGLEAVLDGEIVIVDDKGRPDFQILQNSLTFKEGHMLYYVFDLLYFEGRDLTGLPLTRRKGLLKKILPADPKIKFSDHIEKDGKLFFKVVKEKGLEGIIAKHSKSTYLTGRRSRQWLKIKTRLTQDGIIAGFTEPRGGRKFFGSLVLGAYDGDELVYIGHSGGGFGAKKLEEILEKLKPLVQSKCPFKVRPQTNMPVKWVRPEIVCEIAFHGWTSEGLMRQPVFLGLREDKIASEAIREIPAEKQI